MAFGDPRIVLASAAHGAGSFNTGVQPCPGGDNLSIGITVTAASGTPSLATTIQWSMDGVNLIGGDPTETAFTAITGVGGLTRQFVIKAPFYQVNFTVSGTTPSLTFDVRAYVTL